MPTMPPMLRQLLWRRAPAMLVAAVLAALMVHGATGSAGAEELQLPPASGVETPAVEPLKGDDGIYHQPWFVQSFFDLKEDFAEAKKSGKRFAVIFEQRGCSYWCARILPSCNSTCGALAR